MKYEFYPMSQEEAQHIAYNWHYEGDFSFYDIEADKEDLEEFLDKEARATNYYVVRQSKELVGFFCFQRITEKRIDIGLGMKPELTGNGGGVAFVQAGIDFAISMYKPAIITLSVATFNERAIKVYKNVGFLPIKTFEQHTNGGTYEFLEMKYEV